MNRTGVEPKKKVALFVLDFSKHGGAVGDIVVQGDGIPEGSIIDNGKAHVEDAVLSAGLATLAARLESAADILAATAKASLATNDILDTVPDGTAANAIRTTSAINQMTFTVAVDALIAGRVAVAVEYY